MATETVYADGTVSGNVSTPANAHGADDGTWTTDSGNVDWTHRWSMGNPTLVPAGTQTIRVLARHDDGAGSGQPTIAVSYAINGGAATEIVAATSMAAATHPNGTWLEGTFDASVLGAGDEDLVPGARGRRN